MNWIDLCRRKLGNRPNQKVLHGGCVNPAKPSAQEKPKKKKTKEPTPVLVEESSLGSIEESEADMPDTSIDEESSVEEPVKRGRGRPRKSLTATPQAPPRARSTSVQPTSKAKTAPVKPPPSKAAPAHAGVPGRKHKLAVVPETQLEVSITEEDEVEEVAVPQRRQGSVIPAALTKKSSFEVSPLWEITQGKTSRVKELQTQAEKHLAQYKERVEKRFKGSTLRDGLIVATDDLVASLTAQLEVQKDVVNPSQLKDLESKGNIPGVV
jgi:hypothetical protein